MLRKSGMHTLTASLLTHGTVLVSVLVLASPAGAQWLDRPTPGLPRTADGQPDLTAPAPRTADGGVDLSGLWETAAGPRGLLGVDGRLRSVFFTNVMAGEEDVSFQPWSEAEYRARIERHMVDDPVTRCLPAGVPALSTYPLPFKIVQTPALIVVLYEHNVDFRQIFLDGRALPSDPQPSWLGYSVGRWEGETLVVESTGFNGRAWLDRTGHPQTESLRVIERFRRVTLGRMEVEITIDDPGAYTRPITSTQPLSLLPDTELLEYVCLENEKSTPHFQVP
jgi:hypothetical protein